MIAEEYGSVLEIGPTIAFSIPGNISKKDGYRKRVTFPCKNTFQVRSGRCITGKNISWNNFCTATAQAIIRWKWKRKTYFSFSEFCISSRNHRPLIVSSKIHAILYFFHCTLLPKVVGEETDQLAHSFSTNSIRYH